MVGSLNHISFVFVEMLASKCVRDENKLSTTLRAATILSSSHAALCQGAEQQRNMKSEIFSSSFCHATEKNYLIEYDDT